MAETTDISTPAASGAKPTALLVLGMHRSGTSVLTRVLSLMGANLPTHLLPANDGNESGYWESEELTRLQDELLASLNLAWDRSGAVPEGWHSSPGAVEYRRRVLEILRRDFSGCPMFVLKDPRISLLVPFWIDCLNEFGADQVFIISVRHPLEVAASLTKRNEFLPEKSVLLWLRYMLDAQRSTTGLRRCHVAYEDLLADWRSVVERIATATAITWPRTIEQAAAEIESLISGNLRHHAIAPGMLEADPHVNQWIRDAYAVAMAAARGDESHLIETNDRINAELDSANILFDPLMAEHQASTWKAWHLEREVAARMSEASAAAEQHLSVAKQLHTANHNLHLANTALFEKKGELHALNGRLQGVDSQLQSTTAQLHATESQLQSTILQLKSTEDHLRSTGDQLTSTRAELQSTGERLQSISEQLQTTEVRLQSVSVQLGLTTAELDDRKRAIVRYQEELREREIERRRLIDDLASQNSQISKLTGQLRDQAGNTEGIVARNDAAQAIPVAANPTTSVVTQTKPAAPRSFSVLFRRGISLLIEVANRWRIPKAIQQVWLFNAAYYLDANPDVARKGVDPREHFLRHGWREGRSPHPMFDVPFYLENNPDVANAGANPVLHYLAHGAKEFRSPNRLFDMEFYTRQNPDVIAAGMDPIRHYVDHGGVEGRNPGPLFESKPYADLNPEYKTLGVDPLSHYLWRGIHEGLASLPMSQMTVPMLSERSLFAFGAGLEMLEDPEDAPFNESAMPKGN